MRLATALLALLLWLPLAAQAQQLAPIPALDSPVVDTTGTLEAAQKQALVQQALDLQQRKGSQLQVLVVPTTQPEDIAQYTTRVFDQWQIGRKGVDDGVLLVVARTTGACGSSRVTVLKARFPMPSPTGSSRNTWCRVSAPATTPGASPMPPPCWSS